MVSAVSERQTVLVVQQSLETLQSDASRKKLEFSVKIIYK